MSDQQLCTLRAVNLGPASHRAVAVALVAALSYVSACLGGALVLRPAMLYPLWPGCALLVAALLLSPRRMWPAFLVAGMAGFFLYDLTLGRLPAVSSLLLTLADTLEILIAAAGVRFVFGGTPRFNSVKTLLKYGLIALFAAGSTALVGAIPPQGNYWANWRISFVAEALALLTITPCVLSWAETLTFKLRERPAYYLEAVALYISFLGLAYVTFVGSTTANVAVLLYALVPFLVWAALRFGVIGTSTSIISLVFLSIWGAVYGRGPFTNGTSIENIRSLHLFLLFSAGSFMVLAAVSEERKEAAEELKQGEQRFRVVADTAPVLIWMSGIDKKCFYFNKPWLDFTGRSLEEEFGDGWANGVHPDDLQFCVNNYHRAFDRREQFRMEYRLRRFDREFRWVSDVGVPRFDAVGNFEGYIGSCVDVTERRSAEEALSGLSRRLLLAQEQERKRIARDLHDDVVQRIALLAIELERLEHAPFSPDFGKHIAVIHDRAMKLSTDVQGMSHQLHSSKLEYLGLATAVRSFCREFGQSHQIEVDFEASNLPDSVPMEGSVALFRVLQESLHNAAKYSGVKHFEVELWADQKQVHLTISDFGAGFDVEAAMKGAGLGLLSMQERLKLVNGDVVISSQPSHGTIVHARVPLVTTDEHALKAAG